MRIITLEEHMTTPEFLKATGQEYQSSLQRLTSKLLDIGKGRIADMDANNIDMQVLSLSSVGLNKLDPATATEVVHDVNDKLADAVSAHPDRFAAFAALNLQEPEKAAIEFQRCVKELNFKGAIVAGSTKGIFLDDQRFWPVLETAQVLDVPIYIHPGFPPKSVMDAYYSGFPKNISVALSISGWGWHAETGLHCLRLILSGAFDRFPNLKIIVGHMGDHLPYDIARADRVFGERASESAEPPFKRRVIDYFHENFYITTSGYFDIAPFKCALEIMGSDHVLFSVDYPHDSNARGRQFLDTIDVSPDDFEKITHINAERLLKL